MSNIEKITQDELIKFDQILKKDPVLNHIRDLAIKFNASIAKSTFLLRSDGSFKQLVSDEITNLEKLRSQRIKELKDLFMNGVD